ncbi:MAG: protein translocase subunit SecD [Acidobacteria bacterium]|nr:protein translocase subunit SecD [Acidobacteriota bacterium]
MNRNLLMRGLLVVVVVATCAFWAFPLGDSIRLGLDLRGGIHLLLEVLTDDALRAEAQKDVDSLVQELDEKGAPGVTGAVDSPVSFRLTGLAVDQDELLPDILEETMPYWTWRRADEDVIFDRRPDEVNNIREMAINQALQTIRNRVDEFGVAEPVIQRQGLGSNRLVVQLPGVDDPERVKNLIKNTAFLEFRLAEYPPSGGAAVDTQEILGQYGGTLPDHLEIVAQDLRGEDGNVVGQGYYALEKRPVITGRDLKTARASLGQFQEPVVNFSLTHEGAQIFEDWTGANVGRPLAIVLDGRVQSAPTIESRISDSGVITGSFTQQEVEDLATVLRSGALPAGIEYLEQRAVGPSLGQDSIDQGTRAFAYGIALVLLVMLFVYKGSGINAMVALALNFVLVFGVLAYFGAALTLPGIAGLILTIGMAVDANVLVFERIREELHNGRTVKASVVSGFGKAWSSILDANLTTLIAAIFLINFGTGPIRGFAVTLTVGILASVFTAVFNSRLLFDLLLSRSGRVERLSI